MNDLSFATVTELVGWLGRKETSSVELTTHLLDRLERLGPRYNALAELTRETAERQARAADVARAAGDTRPLLGVPYGAKDIIATAGIPTRWGAPPFKDQVLDHDATVVERLRAAGAVLIGKLSTVELAGAGQYGTPNASINGPGINPWNEGHWSGGSSSGPGSAVSAGLVPFAIGSETRGSLTIPAAFCGITGLRPSYGAVSLFGVQPVSWSFDKIGPLARSADDCELVLAAIAGADERDPRTADWTFRPTSTSTFRIGMLPSDFDGEPEIERAYDAALAELRKLGHALVDVRLPEHDYLAVSQAVGQGETIAAWEDFIRGPRLDELVDPFQRDRLRSYLDQPLATYARAVEQRVGIVRDLRRMFRDVDALAAPTWIMEAPPIDAHLPSQRRLFGGSAVLGALAGLPSISVPMGFGRLGLPLGLVLSADVLNDAAVLAIARGFQRVTDWHRRRPPVDELAGQRGAIA